MSFLNLPLGRTPAVSFFRCILLLALRFGAALAEGARDPDVTFLVRSQDKPRDREHLRRLVDSVVKSGWLADCVVDMSEAARELQHSGLWTYIPWLFQLEEKRRLSRNRFWGQRWYVFMEPETVVSPESLKSMLAEFDSKDDVFLGHALLDEEASIIHHYNTEVAYPHVLLGFALSGSLVSHLAQELRKNPLKNTQQIEPVWELSKWINASRGVQITDKPDAFCTRQHPSCSTWISPPRGQTRPLAADNLSIAVKTVQLFHRTRLRMIHDFWAKRCGTEVLYLSNSPFDELSGVRVVDLSPEFGDLVDPQIESTNQGSGHCAKMQSIIRYLSRHVQGKKWYVVTDDDTLLNVPRLLEVLSFYDDAVPVAIGERYGWSHTEKREGGNYITTGGGLVLSGPALHLLAECRRCVCPKPNAPDDMTLGRWMEMIDVPIMHESGFHQAEPHNYHAKLLASSEDPISFHRFGVRLPASATDKEVTKARRANWRKWISDHFEHRHHDEF